MSQDTTTFEQTTLLHTIPVRTGEPWAETFMEYLLQHPDDLLHWKNLLQHCADCKSSKPSKRWLKQAEEWVESIGEEELLQTLLKVLPLVAEKRCKPNDIGALPENYLPENSKPYQDMVDGLSIGDEAAMELARKVVTWTGDIDLYISQENVQVLKGLLWLCQKFPTAEVRQMLTTIASAMQKKIHNYGPRNTHLANAACIALMQIPGSEGVKQLVVLRALSDYPVVQKQLDRLLTKAAKERNIDLQELKDSVIPDYDLNSGGYYQKNLGQYQLRLRLEKVGKTQLLWHEHTADSEESGFVSTRLPAEVSKVYPQEIKAIKSRMKELDKASSAAARHLEGHFLQQNKLDISTWKDQYLNHPLVMFLARRLIWRLSSCNTELPTLEIIWHQGEMIDNQGNSVDTDGYDQVQLWHPIQANNAQIEGWQHYVLKQQITQPFKQAFREFYVVDSVRESGFQQRILNHTQLKPLAESRGWRMEGDPRYEFKLSKPLSGNLTVSWEGQVQELSDEETWTRYAVTGPLLITKEASKEPVAWSSLSSQVVSEILRDADLFLSVANLETDNRLLQAQKLKSKTEDALGDIASAISGRRLVLQFLIPTLSIAKQLKLEGHFLHVTGKLTSYRIHLKSGHLFQHPSGKHLHIQLTAKKENVFMPFETDIVLERILSMAKKLAADNRIKDSGFLQQLET